MKKILQLIAFVLITVQSIGQNIVPSKNNDYCPQTNITFTVTIPQIKSGTTPNVVSWTGSPNVVPNSISGITSNGTNTTFNFVGSFRDDNVTQVFKVNFETNTNPYGTAEFIYKKIKSLKTPSALSNINTTFKVLVHRFA